MWKKWNSCLPFLLKLFLSIIVLIIYTISTEEKRVIYYIEVLFAPILLLALPLCNKYRFLKTPPLLNYLIALHLFIAIDLGTVLSFYNQFYFWDLLAHGFFGFVFSFLVLMVILNYNKSLLPKPVLSILIVFVVLGFAGLWEIYEFIIDLILKEDTQRVLESISLGKSPLYDTILDMGIAIPGRILFLCSVFIPKFKGYQYCVDYINPTN